MKRITLALLAGLMCGGWGYQAQAAIVDGDDLHEACQSETETGGKTYCLGYIIGVYDAFHMLDDAVHEGNPICLLPNAPSEQLVEVVKKYLEDHPEDRHTSASGIVAIGLAEAYPCT